MLPFQVVAVPRWTHCRIYQCGVSSPKPQMNSVVTRYSDIQRGVIELIKSWGAQYRNGLFILLVQRRNYTHITGIKVKQASSKTISFLLSLCLSGHSSMDSTSPVKLCQLSFNQQFGKLTGQPYCSAHSSSYHKHWYHTIILHQSRWNSVCVHIHCLEIRCGTPNMTIMFIPALFKLMCSHLL